MNHLCLFHLNSPLSPWLSSFLWVPWAHQIHFCLRTLAAVPLWTTAFLDTCIPGSFLCKSQISSHLCSLPWPPIQISPSPVICSRSPCCIFLSPPLPIATCLCVCFPVYLLFPSAEGVNLSYLPLYPWQLEQCPSMEWNGYSAYFCWMDK